MAHDIYAIIYDADDIVSANEIQKMRDIGGKNLFFVCRYCFGKKIEILCSGERINMNQKKDQAQSTKRKQLDAKVLRDDIGNLL